MIKTDIDKKYPNLKKLPHFSTSIIVPVAGLNLQLEGDLLR